MNKNYITTYSKGREVDPGKVSVDLLGNVLEVGERGGKVEGSTIARSIRGE